MKKLALYTVVLAIITTITSCSSTYSAYQFDDIYYNPNEIPISLAQNNTEEALESNLSEENNGYSPFTENSNNSEEGESEYYNTDYAESIEEFNSPMRSFNTHDPYQRDRIMYTQDPFFQTPVGFNPMVTAAPIMPSSYFNSGPYMGMGYNSYAGWNATFGYSWGWGVPNTGWGNNYIDPWGNPFFYGPNFGWGWGSPAFGWGCPRYGYGAYNMAYRQGFNDGYYSGNNSYYQTTRFANTPRGNAGTRTYRNINTTDVPRRATSTSTTIPSSTKRGVSTNTEQANPSRSMDNRSNSTPNRLNTRTPNTDLSPSNNSNNSPIVTPRPNNPERLYPNTNTRPTNPTRVNPSVSPQKAEPRRRSTNFSSPSRDTQPSRSNRTINRSRPSYNSNPSYSPTRNGGNNRMSRPTSPGSRSVRPSRR